ncbi:hypothetical protein [Geodermatophilus amargosae]|uniref:hypothetical protein n=1 Tax=Geodermatophilus amargosae TaxID=1296565 RepID=UPI001FE53D7B|nr:hypothetical protein [Geodermatophilus amargosae]
MSATGPSAGVATETVAPVPEVLTTLTVSDPPSVTRPPAGSTVWKSASHCATGDGVPSSSSDVSLRGPGPVLCTRTPGSTSTQLRSGAPSQSSWPTAVRYSTQ